MNTNEVLKLALEALEYIDLTDNDRDFLHPHECYMIDEAITALREALAEQPAQTDWEAVAADQAMTIALMKAEHPAQGCEYCNHALYSGTKCKNCGRVTEQEALDCFSPNPVTHSKNVEAKLREKNT